MPLRIIATGGTFDKRYDPLTGRLSFGASHLAEIVARARLAGTVEIEVPMMIDSLEMDDAHRQTVLAACRACAERRIVIVHGTDTMVETARLIGEAGLEKTIVVTGAMVPYDVAGSDALFNLGFALGCANTAAHGTWIAMNAVLFAWHNVRKNRERGVFEPL
jgi:L-asparaginase